VITENTLKKYAPGIFSFLTVLFGAVQPLVSAGASALNLTTGLQLAVLVASSITTYLVPLLPSGWQGAAKTGLEVVGVVAAAVIPFGLNGHITQEQLLIVGVAVIKALATEFGVQIRTSVVADALVSGDGLAAPANAAPKHAAS
jgi:hypothetical protein